jgi:hypothetical protein
MRFINLIIIILAGLPMFSQKPKFQEGILITKSGEKLKGLINWKKFSSAGDSVIFKKNETSPETHFSWNDLTDVLNVDNKLILKICTVRRNLEYVDANDFTIRLKDSIAEETIPLTPVYSGKKLSLYQFYDKAPFYFVYDGKKMLQLVQKYRYLTMQERLFDYQQARRFLITDVYKGLLATFYNFHEDKKLQYILDNTIYDERSLKYLISKMDSKMK